MRRFFVGLAITAMLGVVPCQARGNDRQISQAIVKSLQAEQKSGKLKGFDIDLEVENGTVYLKGTVASEEQEQLALDIARRVEDVRQVYNELSIKPLGERDEMPTAARVLRKVTGTSTPEPNEIDDSESAAEAIDSRVHSVSSQATNESSGRGTRRPDSNAASRELAARIIERLKEEKAAGKLKGFSLDVEVDNGVAWLSGKVATPEQQNSILETVRRVPGVKQVVNGLSVTRATSTPSAIAQQVIAHLQEKKSSGELKDFSIDVEVDQGVVWLSGNAANDQQLQLILDTARYVPGVSKVVNDISIPGRIARAKPADGAMLSAQQAVARSSSPTEAKGRITPPQPLPLEDGPIGSAVAGSAISEPRNQASAMPAGNPAAQQAPNGRQVIQYVWVPAGQAPGQAASQNQTPLAFAPARPANYTDGGGMGGMPAGQPMPLNPSTPGSGIAAARFDHPQMPQYAWPSYAPYPNYGAVTYPKQYSPMAWPYIGPFYPYPQVPLGWRKVELKWKDGWWQLDFKDRH
jgi:osmotically-inducible protein OsmY